MTHFSSRITNGYNCNIDLINATLPPTKQRRPYLTQKVSELKDLFLHRCLEPAPDGEGFVLKDRYAKRGGAYVLEFWCRLLQREILRGLHAYDDFFECNPAERIAEYGTHEKRIQQQYSCHLFERVNPQRVLKLFIREERNWPGVPLTSFTLYDLICARLWFAGAEPVADETTWELYKRYDPDGSRAMHQAQFYSLLPRAWSKLPHYQYINATYKDCLAAEQWFASATPLKDETTWELYKRYDPDGSRAMNLAQFYSLLPRAWRDRPNYQCINTTYKDCLVAEKWFASVTPLKGETTWELYKRYDPDGSRAMHQARFYSLMPSAWRKLPQYQYINATYEDCLAAEKWFDSVTPLEGETTWELYKRYDTDGSRAMNQAQFYSLLPSTWRDMQQYQRINATYEDCLAAERWFDSVTPLEGETTWELYKRYDPDGSRAMNQGNFYSLLPRVWRDMPQYQCINAPYTDCLAAEKWFDSITPLKGETTWELYKRYDPDGSRAMHQAQFYSLLPRVWRDMQQYQCINAPYTDCLAAEKWFASANPLEGETTWELYKRYDSDGSRAMNQAHFFSLLPHAWRKLPQYQYIGATYEDCLAAEKWFDSVTPLEGETTWELYKRYDPDGYRAMHQRQFYSLLPSTWRDMPQYQCISATYEDCLVAEKWFASATPLEGETTWELYKRYDPDGSRAMHQAHFFSLLPRAWRKLPQYQCINATYEDCLVAEKWFASVNPLKGETIWELYNRFDPTSALGMRQGEFFSLLPQGWRDLYQNNDPSWGTTS